MIKNKSKTITGAVLFVIFVIYTALVKFVDVSQIGPEGSSVGFSLINKAALDVFAYNNFWYELTDWTGYIALGVCLGFAMFGFLQLVKRKSLKKVDCDIWILAGFYVVVLAFYALFEVIVINYRPVILEEGLEASYPSSHTVLATCVFASACFMVERYFSKKSVLKKILQFAFILLAAATIIGRMLSGVHWISDIFGGLILSFALLFVFFGFFEKQ